MGNIDISGDYTISQSNATQVNVHMEQKGNQLGGNARFRNVTSNKLYGTVSGEHVDFNIEWSDKHTGHYWGDLFEPHSHRDWEGYLKGDTKDVCHPSNWAHWSVEDRTFRTLFP